MPRDWLNENNLKYRLTVDGRRWGYFNGPELELGSESGSNTDPELGEYQTGGKKIGSEMELDRPWNRSRDYPLCLAGDTSRGSSEISLALVEFDDIGQEIRTLFTKNGTLQKVSGPPANAKSSDPTSFKVTVDLNP